MAIFLESEKIFFSKGNLGMTIKLLYSTVTINSHTIPLFGGNFFLKYQNLFIYSH